MKEGLIALHKLRKELQKKQDLLKIEKDNFALKIQGLVDGIKMQQSAMVAIEEQIRAEALSEFNDTGNKKLLGGIGIRCWSTLEYDEAEALEYAKNHGVCLALDKKSFGKLADAIPLDFVVVKEKVTVTFPKEIKIEELI